MHCILRLRSCEGEDVQQHAALWSNVQRVPVRRGLLLIVHSTSRSLFHHAAYHLLPLLLLLPLLSVIVTLPLLQASKHSCPQNHVIQQPSHRQGQPEQQLLLLLH